MTSDIRKLLRDVNAILVEQYKGVKTLNIRKEE